MKHQFDFLVIGSGIAGLVFAIRASKSGSVAILTKKDRAESNTNYAQGGIASVMAVDDNLDAHIQDTLETGSGLCHESVVRDIVKKGPQAIQNLLHLGVDFSRDQNGSFDLGREGGHSKRRVLHAGDFTGKVIEEALLHQIKTNPHIEIFEHHAVIDLLTSRKLGIEDFSPNRCLGVEVFDTSKNKIEIFTSKITVLCTGGAGKVYLYTSNPDIATGDGLAMAWRAGAKVANMEFVQFHPTCLYHPKAKNFLLSEALRGEGGVLRLKNGDLFMKNYDSREELASRDIVARAIDSELKKRNEDYVLLDMTHIPADYLLERFPNIHQRVLEYGYDLIKEPIPVVPAAHYMCGGVMVNHLGETGIKNLFACGEVAFTGFHGGNRLASNSLLEAVVYAEASSDEACQRLKDIHFPHEEIHITTTAPQENSSNMSFIENHWSAIRETMWNDVGIVRSSQRLNSAIKKIRTLSDEIIQYAKIAPISSDLLELKNIAIVAELIIRSAIWRKESRGLHYNTDYPSQSEMYRRDTILEP